MKKILVVGANSFLAKHFINIHSDTYSILKTYRKPSVERHSIALDFTNEDQVESFLLENGIYLDGIIFFQGINPSRNLKSHSYESFSEMFQVNVIGPSIFLKQIMPSINNKSVILFLSSIAVQKGSYDPSYAAAKAAIEGLVISFSNAFPKMRFNAIRLGLVKDSPVFEGMTEDFRRKHASNMFNHELVKPDNVASMIHEIIENDSINKAIISLDGGYRI